MEKLNVFTSPFVQYAEHNGKEFEIIRELSDEENPDKEEVGSMFRVKFSTGEEIDAWPEEIYKDQIVTS